MTNIPINILIASAPGRTCDNLRTLITESALDLRIVGITNSAAATMAALSGHLMDIVIVDANLPRNDALNLLSYLHCSKKQMHSIFLAEYPAQLPKGWHLGADMVLIRGFTVQELDRGIERMLRAPSLVYPSPPMLFPIPQ
jgi:DNA-binding NarL/FixJ family response regulator